MPPQPLADPLPFPGDAESRIIAFFVDGVRVLGLPRSLGEIYGLLFVSPVPLSLDDLVRLLNISKGSASQGLRSLKNLGAVRECPPGNPADRKTYYEPAIELKRLVGGFIREQVRPHLESGREKITQLAEITNGLENRERREFLTERIERIDQWMRRGGMMLPILQKMLGQ